MKNLLNTIKKSRAEKFLLTLIVASHQGVLSANTLDAESLRDSAIVLEDEFGHVVPALINDHVQLGTAYNSKKSKFLNVRPVAGKMQLSGATSYETSLVENLSYDDVLSELSGKVDVNLNFPVVRVDAGGSIAKEMSSSTYSSNYTFQAYAKGQQQVFVPIDEAFTLSPVGDKLANEFSTQLENLVGDEFVTGINYSANLLVNMKIEYRSAKDKLDIHGHVNMDVKSGVVTLEGNLHYLSDDVKKSVKITVRAIQYGGEPLQLLTVIPDNIVSCTLDNPDPCFTLFSKAVKYGKNETNGFKTQLSEPNDYNVVSYQTKPYSKSPRDVRRLVKDPGAVNLETKRKIRELEENFKVSIKDEARASSLITGYLSWFSENEREVIRDIKSKAYDNAWVYYKAALFCRDHPYGKKCIDYWKNIVEATCDEKQVGCIHEYDKKSLEIPSTNNLTSNLHVCENARQVATDHGLISNRISLGFRKFQLAPVFIDNSNPGQGIVEWAPCEFSLSTYDNNFADS